MKRRVGTLSRSSGGVYKDIAGKQYIVNLKEAKAYLLEGANEKKYVLYQNKLLLILFGGALLTYFVNLKIGIIVAAIILAILEVYFRIIFIKKLDEYEYENILDEGAQNNVFVKYDKTKLFLTLIIHIALAACILVNFFQTVYVIPFNEWENKQIYIVIGSAIVILIILYNLVKLAAAFRAKQIEKK